MRIMYIVKDINIYIELDMQNDRSRIIILLSQTVRPSPRPRSLYTLLPSRVS